MSRRQWTPRPSEDVVADERAMRAITWFCRRLMAAILLWPAAGLAVVLWSLR